jgi:hypothetical protein
MRNGGKAKSDTTEVSWVEKVTLPLTAKPRLPSSVQDIAALNLARLSYLAFAFPTDYLTPISYTPVRRHFCAVCYLFAAISA